MTIKHHIIIITVITLFLIVLITFYDEIKSSLIKNQQNKSNVQTEKNENSLNSNNEYIYKNLLVNCDFNNGLDGWDHDKDVAIVQDNGKNCIELTAQENGLTRIWQTISATSGHVYKLSYFIKAPKIAFSFFRDVQSGNVKTFYTSPTDNWKEYQFKFKSKKDAKYQVYLGCKESGKYYYSNISLVDTTSGEVKE